MIVMQRGQTNSEVDKKEHKKKKKNLQKKGGGKRYVLGPYNSGA